MEFEEHLGYFWADVQRSATMPNQTVDSLEQTGPLGQDRARSVGGARRGLR